MSETIIAAAVQIVAIAAAAGVGYLVGAAQTRERRRLEKQTNSIQVMLSLCNDRDLLRASGLVSEIDDDPDDESGKYACPPAKEWEKSKLENWLEKRGALRALVNFFETVSVGICNNIYDRDIIFGCARTMFLKNFDRTKGFIYEMRRRRNVDSYGEHFERVAEEFGEGLKSPPK